MEKRKYDQDEMLIRQVLESAYPKNFDILKGVEAKMNPKKIFRKGFAMAILAASLMVASVAAAHYVGAFERLAGIIGQERADELTPLEIMRVDDEQSPHNDGIGLELVAIELSDDSAYIYFTMDDFIANRLEGDFFVMHHLVPSTPIDGFMVITNQPEIINRDVNGVVTFRSRFEFSEPIKGVELIYSIRAIRYGEFHHPPQVMSINLIDFVVEAPAALFQTASPGLSAEGADDGLLMRYMELIVDEGLPVLAPHALDIEFGLDRVNSRLSNIGVVNGRLHIQIYTPDMRAENVSLFIVNKNDLDMIKDSGDAWSRRIPHLFGTQFSVANDGTLYCDPVAAHPNTHFEEIFDIDLENINMEERVLVVSVFGSGWISIDWSVAFDLDD